MLQEYSSEPYLATQSSTACEATWVNNHAGCGYFVDAMTYPGASTTYGDGFNAVGGGVYAMEWASDLIKIWHFERASVPADITSGNPDPAAWGLPMGVFGGDTCDVDTYFNQMRLVINIVGAPPSLYTF